ncbi:MAG: hypothetical protein U1F61_01020 [Opitutaceae bacterium]
MPIKIISGVLFPTLEDLSLGSAKINFKDGKLLPGSGAQFKEVNVIGTGDFLSKPCVQVSLRHITIKESDKKGFFGGSTLNKHVSFNLNDDFIIEKGQLTGMSVSWSATPHEDGDANRSQISEISVLIIGETK